MQESKSNSTLKVFLHLKCNENDFLAPPLLESSSTFDGMDMSNENTASDAHSKSSGKNLTFNSLANKEHIQKLFSNKTA